MKTYNNDFYDLFTEIADLLAITGEGNFFQIRAYQEAGRMLKEETHPIFKKGASVEAFEKLPRIGEALAIKMMQYIETGEMAYLEELRAKVPASVRELLKIPGIGPKSVKKLYLEAGIQSKADLIGKAESGELEKLEGFGKKSVEKILEAISDRQEKKKRHTRQEAESVITPLLPVLRQLKGVKQADVAGSYRRQADTVGDVDILVSGSIAPQKLETALLSVFPTLKLLGSGETKISFMLLPQNLQVDVRLVGSKNYGAALLYFTGSKDFNVNMRREAIKQGCLLNEYSLSKQGKVLASRTEEEIFKALGMSYVEPEKRK